MPRPRTLLIRTEVDTAKRAHKCRANARHQITKGQKRLKVRRMQGWDHYCLDCAEHMVERAANKLAELSNRLENEIVS